MFLEGDFLKEKMDKFKDEFKRDIPLLIGPQLDGGKIRNRVVNMGTVIAGAVGRDSRGDYVVLGSDSEVSMGDIILRPIKPVKIKETDYYSAVAITGTVSLAQFIVKRFGIILRSYRDQFGQYLSPKGKANVLGNMVRKVFQLFIYNITAAFILGVYNPIDHEARLFTIGSFGSVLEYSQIAEGSATENAEAILEQEYSKEMPRQKMINLIKKAINSGKRHNIYCGGDTRTVIIDKNGVREINVRRKK